MWKIHDTSFPGNVPITWLEGNDLYICRYCVQLVSNSRLSTHSKKCVRGAAAAQGSEDTPIPVGNPPVEAPPLHQPEPSLPTFEEVCFLNQPSLRFIPSGSRPASPEHCHQLCDVSFKRTQRMHSSNFSCSRSVFFLHQAIDGNTEDLFQ